jgi:hypothetical protein
VQVGRIWVAVAVGIVALATPAVASGATLIGETFPPGTAACASDHSELQTGSPGGHYAAPSAGVITSWSFQAHVSMVPTVLKLKVGRPVGGNMFTIVGESAEKSPIANALNTYTDVRIPVQAGDVIGYYAGAMPGVCGRSASADYRYRTSPPGDQSVGSTVPYGDEATNVQFNISAGLEPDCDSDGLGDETQDAAVPLGGPCPKGNRSVALDANKNKVNKGRRVTLAGQVNEVVRQGPCESGQPVELQRKKPSKTTFTTVEQLQTDAAGAFTTKEKVKKTFEYRAQVLETATCAGQTSNTEKVKVKKKK